ncbi:MAG: 2-oxoglutarate and iron-dependent oxygenase domain-containing protein [Rhodobacter sp.]|nr:2-oxoglutarate and iron-dependent oxygenase domain-containing protein [Rhodobacter sp.]
MNATQDIIPEIDLTAAREGTSAARAETAAAIDSACRSAGFFTVRGTGIPASVTDRAFSAFAEFVKLPSEVKEACRPEGGATLPEDPFTPYGYSALLEENAYAYMGETDKPADYVEKFSAGRLMFDDPSSLPVPDGPLGPELRAALMNYFREAEKLSRLIVGLTEEALGLTPGFFTDRISNSFDSLRCHSYPARAPEFSNDQGMGAHKDGSLITLLAHTSEGIEVRLRGGDWLRVPARSPYHFTVNIGDLLSGWTDGAYVSTPHRVVLTRRPRHSIVFFKLTDEDELTQAGDQQMDALFGR